MQPKPPPATALKSPKASPEKQPNSPPHPNPQSPKSLLMNPRHKNED